MLISINMSKLIPFVCKHYLFSSGADTDGKNEDDRPNQL